MSRRIEVCVFSVEDALVAALAGADRLEVCVNYGLGGVSMPLADLAELAEKLKEADFLNAQGKIRAAVMCRPRGGDFCYSDDEFDVLFAYAEKAAFLGFEALVSGMLRKKDGSWDLDNQQLSKVLAICKKHDVEFVFHRAFDELNDPVLGLQRLAFAGVDRVLTGWGQRDGSMLLTLLEKSKQFEIDLLPGGGIRSNNVGEYWSAGVNFIHSAAGSLVGENFLLDQQELQALLLSRKNEN